MRFGLIGYGLWGRHHAAALAKAPGAELAAIACASEATAAAARRDFPSVLVDIGYRRLVGRADIDAVVVSVPNHLHAEVGVAALAAGKDVLLEKPMATTLDDSLSVQALGAPRAGEAGMSSDLTVILRFPRQAHAVITETLAGFEYHQLLHVVGSEGAIRSWWSGALDRTLHPSFELRVAGR